MLDKVTQMFKTNKFFLLLSVVCVCGRARVRACLGRLLCITTVAQHVFSFENVCNFLWDKLVWCVRVCVVFFNILFTPFPFPRIKVWAQISLCPRVRLSVRLSTCANFLQKIPSVRLILIFFCCCFVISLGLAVRDRDPGWRKKKEKENTGCSLSRQTDKMLLVLKNWCIFF